MASSLGPFYLIVLPLSALISFILVLILLFRGKGSLAGVSLLLLVHMPMMIGIFAGIQGLISSYQVIALGGSTPKPAEIAMGVSTALFAPLVGMLLMVPSYLTAMIGTFARAIAGAKGTSAS